VEMKVITYLIIFACITISCFKADENDLGIDEELNRWEEYKVRREKEVHLVFKVMKLKF
jgi:hypothetical protein